MKLIFHLPCSYDELVEKYKVTYVAGGASQNAARGAAVCRFHSYSQAIVPSHQLRQYVLPPGSVVYTGCVGDDELAEQLKAANKREGLDQRYMVKKGEHTGACAVIITGHDRYVLSRPPSRRRLTLCTPAAQESGNRAARGREV